MDYEFRCNTLDGSFRADFSMGHEAIGRWLIDELSTDPLEIDNVICQLKAVIEEGGLWQRNGAFFNLQVSQEEALIQENIIMEYIENEELEDNFHAYEQESISICGPEDLLSVLLAWKDFLCRFGSFSKKYSA